MAVFIVSTAVCSCLWVLVRAYLFLRLKTALFCIFDNFLPRFIGIYVNFFLSFCPNILLFCKLLLTLPRIYYLLLVYYSYMTDTHFYILKMKRLTDGSYEASGEKKDLEADFPGLKYKSVSGLNLYGETQVYAETFAEDEHAYVYSPSDDIRKQTDITLTLYFFGADPDGGELNGMNEETQLANAQACFDSFMEFISGDFLCYWDNVRQRKVLCYQTSAISIKNDTVIGIPYKQVEIKLKNVYGRSFSLSNETFNPIS